VNATKQNKGEQNIGEELTGDPGPPVFTGVVNGAFINVG
jgi:hypothetical protein